jgi:alkanesulfonate monooxygenase SsuD/methylene tetrahydromethanopterin reductase-like flavin-dependent oxidoreductase (luciferase family)
MKIGFRTSPQNTDWASLDAAWAEAGQHEVFDSGWLNDHLMDPVRDRGGAAFEAMTTLAALAHHVPGKEVGQTVLAATFRHPGMLAKEAITLDHLTGGRYILGLGSGWHVGEHESFGIELPSIGERFDRYESTIRVLRALFSDEARVRPGCRSMRLRGASMARWSPAVHRAVRLCGSVARGRAGPAAAYADGWNSPPTRRDARGVQGRDLTRSACGRSGATRDDDLGPDHHPRRAAGQRCQAVAYAGGSTRSPDDPAARVRLASGAATEVAELLRRLVRPPDVPAASVECRWSISVCREVADDAGSEIGRAA